MLAIGKARTSNSEEIDLVDEKEYSGSSNIEPTKFLSLEPLEKSETTPSMSDLIQAPSFAQKLAEKQNSIKAEKQLIALENTTRNLKKELELTRSKFEATSKVNEAVVKKKIEEAVIKINVLQMAKKSHSLLCPQAPASLDVSFCNYASPSISEHIFVTCIHV